VAFSFRGGKRRGSTVDDDLRATESAVSLAARIRTAFGEDGRILLFTGATAGDGVSTVTSQVALALAQMEQGPVLVVDANLRRPSLGDVFGVEPGPGLSDVILKETSLEEAIRVTERPMLSILPVGTTPVDPVRLFTSAGWMETLGTARSRFRFTLLDSAPLLGFADTTLIVPGVDGVVVVVAAGARRRGELREVEETLAGLRARLLGVVLFDRRRR
jgi:capsular exopolysaccharide synthesis family protein